MTPRDHLVDDFEESIEDTELILNNVLPPITKRPTSKKYRVPTLRRIQEESGVLNSQHGLNQELKTINNLSHLVTPMITPSPINIHTSQSKSMPSQNSVTSASSLETPPSLRTLLIKMGTSAIESSNPTVKNMDSRFDSNDSLIKFDSAPIIHSGRASFVTSSPTPSTSSVTPPMIKRNSTKGKRTSYMIFKLLHRKMLL